MACTKLLGYSGPEVLDIDVGCLDESEKSRVVRWFARVEFNGVLIAVVRLKVRAIETAIKAAEWVSGTGDLDLDDIRADIRQHHAAGGTGDVRSVFKNANAAEHVEQGLLLGLGRGQNDRMPARCGGTLRPTALARWR